MTTTTPCPASRQKSSIRDLLLLLLLLLIPFFLFLGNVGLIEPDEGRYSEIPREMLERGDFITPTLNYVNYFEKPPLHYWLTAASFKLFGLNEFAGRFPGALAGLLTVLTVYLAGRRLFGRRTGLYGALILGTSTGFLAQSRINLTDMTLTFCLTAALCCYMVASAADQRRPRCWYGLFFVFCGLAVLAKGLIGMVFPAGIVLLHMLVSRRWRLMQEMPLVRGLLLFLATTAPWFVLVSLRNPEFARFFFIHEHFERYLTAVHGRYQPAWYFLPVLLLTLLPWSFYILRAVWRGWKQRHEPQGDQLTFLMLWAAFIFSFFSASHSKLVPYILPLFPPLALLIGSLFSDSLSGEERQRRFGVETVLLGGVCLVAALLMAAYPHVRELTPLLTASGMVRPGSSLLVRPPHLTPVGGALVAGIFLAMTATAVVAFRKHSLLVLFVGLCLSSWLLETVGLYHFMEGVARRKSTRELALKARDAAAGDAVLASFGYDQLLPFYSGRRILVVGQMGELQFGSRCGAQSAWFVDEPRFLQLWRGERRVVLVLDRESYRRMEPQLSPAPFLLGSSDKKLLIANRTPELASRQ